MRECAGQLIAAIDAIGKDVAELGEPCSQALQQRDVLVLGLREHAAIEREGLQLAIEEVRGIETRGTRRRGFRFLGHERFKLRPQWNITPSAQ